MPIYLAGGILLTAKGLLAGMSLPLVIAYISLVCLCLKMLACAVQQKLFGERLGSFIAVRQAVGVNSNTVRVMKVILAEPGLTAPKVAILLGGPDWPTSVLCGILRLPLCGILVGTLPIVAVILPAVMSGAFMYLTDNPEYPWAATMAAICATLTGGIQTAAGMYAARAIAGALKERSDLLADTSGLDQEVLARDKIAAEQAALYHGATKWTVLTACARYQLAAATGLMIASCYLFSFAYTFRDLGLTDTVACTLDGHGDRLVYPEGWLAIGLFCASAAVLKLFDVQARASRGDAPRVRIASVHRTTSHRRLSSTRRRTRSSRHAAAAAVAVRTVAPLRWPRR